jgi:prepilin-type N-terminal cleavage/methylation domain-containing protein
VTSDTRRDEGGFTLVELMVVVLIIGILVSIAIPVFNAARSSAELRTCWANQRTIEGAAQQYRARYGALWTQGHRLNGNGSANTADQLVPMFIKAAPVCPTTRQYYYVDASGTVLGDTSAAAFTAGHGHY